MTTCDPCTLQAPHAAAKPATQPPLGELLALLADAPKLRSLRLDGSALRGGAALAPL